MISRRMGRAFPAAMLVIAVSLTGKEIDVTADAPRVCVAPQVLRLTLLDIDMPRSQAANIRIYAILDDGTEVYAGLASVLAQDGGSRRTGNLAVTSVESFRKWIAEKKPTGKLPLRLRPFGGASKPLTSLDWKVRAAEWSCR